MLLAGLLVISRRPDAIMHAQFWAEDGKLFYADVYNRGLAATLTVPQSGYFQELPILAAGLARLVPLAYAPLVMNATAIVVRVLPVGLLLSRRAETISPDLRVRTLLAALYIALPGSAEANANAVNAAWYLAVAAVIILMLRPPTARSARVLDVVILTLCSVTGVFTIVLAPLAFVYRRWRGPSAVSEVKLVILAGGAALQMLAIFVLQYRLPSGFGAAPRVVSPLHATAHGFLQILGTRVIAGPVLGNSASLSTTTEAFLGMIGVIGALIMLRRGSSELKLMIMFGIAMFAVALARPLDTDWAGLLGANGSRYFIIPQLAAVAALVRACIYNRRNAWLIVLASVLLYMCVVTIPREWSYPPFRETGFVRQASRFEHVPPGAQMIFPVEPSGWTMTLVKH
jgi:hypothetical protein